MLEPSRNPCACYKRKKLNIFRNETVRFKKNPSFRRQENVGSELLKTWRGVKYYPLVVYAVIRICMRFLRIWIQADAVSRKYQTEETFAYKGPCLKLPGSNLAFSSSSCFKNRVIKTVFSV